MTWDNRLFTRITGLQCALPCIKPQPALLLFRTMALEAMLFQNGADIANEIRLSSGADHLGGSNESHRDDDAEVQNAPANLDSALESHKAMALKTGSARSNALADPCSFARLGPVFKSCQ